MAIIVRRDALWVGFLAATFGCRVLPRSMRLRSVVTLGRWLGSMWQRFDRPFAGLARSNLQLLLRDQGSHGDLDGRVRTFFQNVAQGMLVIDIMPTLEWDDLCRFLRLEGAEHLDAALSLGRGVVLVGAHFGLHSYAATMFLQRLGYPMVIATGEGVARGDTSAFYRRIMRPIRYRFHRGMRVIMLNGTPQRNLVGCLRQNQVLMIMGDFLDEEVLRLPPPNVLSVPFLGYSIPLKTGPFRLARWQGAPVIPFFMVPRADGYALVIEPPLPLTRDRTTTGLLADLAAFTARLERHVAHDPALWFGPRGRDLRHFLQAGAQGRTPHVSSES